MTRRDPIKTDMGQLISNLAAVSMVVHSVLGCCWHHQHEGMAMASTQSQSVNHAACCCHDSHAGHRHSPSEPTKQQAPEGHHCQEGACHLPAVRPDRLIEVPTPGAGGTVLAIVLPAPCIVAETGRTVEPIAGETLRGSPPIYLLTQSLLL